MLSTHILSAEHQQDFWDAVDLYLTEGSVTVLDNHDEALTDEICVKIDAGILESQAILSALERFNEAAYRELIDSADYEFEEGADGDLDPYSYLDDYLDDDFFTDCVFVDSLDDVPEGYQPYCITTLSGPIPVPGKYGWLGNPWEGCNSDSYSDMLQFEAYFYARMQLDPKFRDKINGLRDYRVALWDENADGEFHHGTIIAEYLSR